MIFDPGIRRPAGTESGYAPPIEFGLESIRMARAPDSRLEAFLARLALASSHEEQEELGRSELSGLLHHVSSEQLAALVKAARRDGRLRRSLAAARYYSGLSAEKCAVIDSVLSAPFPAAATKRRRK